MAAPTKNSLWSRKDNRRPGVVRMTMERLRTRLALLCLTAAIRLDGELVDIYVDEISAGSIPL